MQLITLRSTCFKATFLLHPNFNLLSSLLKILEHGYKRSGRVRKQIFIQEKKKKKKNKLPFTLYPHDFLLENYSDYFGLLYFI
jgi:hypothetical protein